MQAEPEGLSSFQAVPDPGVGTNGEKVLGTVVNRMDSLSVHSRWREQKEREQKEGKRKLKGLAVD